MIDEEQDPLDKPLPSVGMPLLREERKASRAKRVAWLTSLGLLLITGAVAAVGLGSLQTPESDEAPSPVPSVAAAPPKLDAQDSGTPPAVAVSPYTPTPAEEPTHEVEFRADLGPAKAPTRVTTEFGRAKGFRQALIKAGVREEECEALETALTELIDFRRCQPDDKMVLEREQTGDLVRFEYHPGPTEFFEASRKADGSFSGKKVAVPVDTVRLARGGTIETSLGNALSKQNLGRALVGTFVEVFDGDINFITDTREGDTFKIIVDEERIDGQFLRYGVAHAIEYNGTRTGLQRAFWFEPRKGEGDYFDESGRAIHGGWIRTPVRYDRISSRFNPRRMHPILKRIVPHTGVDYAAGTGTPVWAAADGEVSFAGPKGANGNLVAIKHQGGFESAYAHLHRIKGGIKPGVRVKQRQIIGYVGSTGRSTGPHLHFGLKRNGRWVDPLSEINGPGRMMASSALPRFRRHVRKLLSQLARISVPAGPNAPPRSKEPEPDDSPMD